MKNKLFINTRMVFLLLLSESYNKDFFSKYNINYRDLLILRMIEASSNITEYQISSILTISQQRTNTIISKLKNLNYLTAYKDNQEKILKKYLTITNSGKELLKESSFDLEEVLKRYPQLNSESIIKIYEGLREVSNLLGLVDFEESYK